MPPVRKTQNFNFESESSYKNYELNDPNLMSKILKEYPRNAKDFNALFSIVEKDQSQKTIKFKNIKHFLGVSINIIEIFM